MKVPDVIHRLAVSQTPLWCICDSGATYIRHDLFAYLLTPAYHYFDTMN